MGLKDWFVKAEQDVVEDVKEAPEKLQELEDKIAQAIQNLIVLQTRVVEVVRQIEAFRAQHAKEIGDLRDFIASVQLGVPGISEAGVSFLKMLDDWQASMQHPATLPFPTPPVPPVVNAA